MGFRRDEVARIGVGMVWLCLDERAGSARRLYPILGYSEMGWKLASDHQTDDEAAQNNRLRTVPARAAGSALPDRNDPSPTSAGSRPAPDLRLQERAW